MDSVAADGIRPPGGSAKALLEVDDLGVRFGGIVALQSVSFAVREGDIVGLIGPNGAGKTTVFNCLSRIYTPRSGDMRLDGRSILRHPRHGVAALGIARTFQNVALFDRLTVLQNVLVGGHLRGRCGFLGAISGLPGVTREDAALRRTATEMIAFMELLPYRDRIARDLPFPTRKRIELARALMIRPRLLLLDEPAAGLNHEEVEILKAQLLAIRDQHRTTILLVEHHMNLVMSVSDHVVVMDFGRKIADGPPAQIQRDETVIRAYLGAA